MDNVANLVVDFIETCTVSVTSEEASSETDPVKLVLVATEENVGSVAAVESGLTESADGSTDPWVVANCSVASKGPSVDAVASV